MYKRQQARHVVSMSIPRQLGRTSRQTPREAPEEGGRGVDGVLGEEVDGGRGTHPAACRAAHGALHHQSRRQQRVARRVRRAAERVDHSRPSPAKGNGPAAHRKPAGGGGKETREQGVGGGGGWGRAARGSSAPLRPPSWGRERQGVFTSRESEIHTVFTYSHPQNRHTRISRERDGSDVSAIISRSVGRDIPRGLFGGSALFILLARWFSVVFQLNLGRIRIPHSAFAFRIPHSEEEEVEAEAEGLATDYRCTTPTLHLGILRRRRHSSISIVLSARGRRQHLFSRVQQRRSAPPPLPTSGTDMPMLPHIL